MYSSYGQENRYEVHIGTDNDFFVWFEESDRYYTYGVNVAFNYAPVKESFFSKAFPGKVNFIRGYGIQLMAFTPGNDENNGDPTTFDRPFAGWLFGSTSFAYFFERSIFRTRLELGVLGPAAHAGELQNWLHEKITGDPRVEGWSNQFDNQLGINLEINYAVELKRGRGYNLIFDPEVSLGSIFTYMMPRATLRLGWFDGGLMSGYQDIHLINTSDRNQLFLDVSAGAKLVGYDATIQGGLFNDQEELDKDDINRGISVLSAGLTFVGQHFAARMAYFRTRGEIEAQEKHRYGSIGLFYRF